MRQSGISAVGAVPWGTHFCHFYTSAQDLVDVLVPFMQAGLEADECCLWVTSPPLPPEAAAECVEKGGIAVDGVSLTIASLDGGRVSVAVIPHTWENTTLRFLRPGDSVNVETDVIGKYVLSAVRAILGKDGRSGLDADFLRRHGFA